MKKILAVFLAMVMLLSMVTVSAAENKNTVEYINANTSEIVIELLNRVTESELKNAITLTKDGSAINFSVTLKPATPTPHLTEQGFFQRTVSGAKQYLSVRPLAENKNYTYVITPEGGLEFDSQYILDIDSELLETSYRAKIVVKEFFTDEFDYTDSTTPWVKNSAGSIAYENGEVVLGKASAAYLSSTTANILGNSNMSAKNYRDKNSAKSKINLEMSVKFDDITKKHNAGLGLSTIGALSIGSSMKDAVSFSVGGNDDGTKHTALFIAKYNANGDPVYTNYPGTKYTSFYASATKAEGSGGSYISDANKYGMSLPGTTTIFKSKTAEKIAMYYDADNKKIIYEGGSDLYNYSYDMPEVSVKPLPVFFNQGSGSASFDKLILSYPVIEEILLESYTIKGPVYWNAASDTITLDFDAHITPSELLKKIKIYDAEGNQVEISGIKLLNDVTRNANLTGKYTYQVKLSNLFEDEEIYTLVLPAGKYIDDNGAPAMLEHDYTVTFKIDLFVFDSFETYKEGASTIYTDKCVTTMPWSLLSKGKYGKLEVKVDGENKYLKLDNTASSSTTTGRMWVVPNASKSDGSTFANTTYGGYDYSTKSEARLTSDYTMEADIKVVDQGEKGYQVRMYQASARDTAGSTPHNELTVAKSESGELSIGVYTHNGSNAYIKDHMATAGVDLASDDYVRLSMSIKDKDHKWNVGSHLIHEVADYKTATAQNIGIPLFDIDEGRVNNVYHIDNVILSKAKEVDAITCSDVVINGNPDITELPASTIIEKASVTITNNGQAKNFVALLVVRNSKDDSTVRVYKSNTDSISASATMNIEFTNIDISGGDSLEAYIWQDLKNIGAYTTAKVFPKK